MFRQVSLVQPAAVGAVAACGREQYRLPLILSGDSPVPPPPAARCSAAALERLTAAAPASCRLSLSRPASGVSADQLFRTRVVLSADTGQWRPHRARRNRNSWELSVTVFVIITLIRCLNIDSL